MKGEYASLSKADGFKTENAAMRSILTVCAALKKHDSNLKLQAACGPSDSINKMSAGEKRITEDTEGKSDVYDEPKSFSSSVLAVGFDTKNDAIKGALVAVAATKKHNPDVCVSATVHKQGDLTHQTKVKLEDKTNEN